MPRTASSTGGESEKATTGPQPGGNTSRYRCPVDFVSASYKTCRSTFRKKLKKSSKELWLIKAPASFDPECFQDFQVPLSGLQTLKVHATEGGAKSEADQRIYHVRASAQGPSELYLLTGGKSSSESLGLGPSFSGLLTVCESYGDSSQQPLQVIPAAPAPSIPAGLKHRFPRFTQTSSTCSEVKTEADGCLIEETKEDDQEGRKKKRKKEKRMKLEPEETDILRMNENVAEIQEEILEETKKKKKKKKKSEQEEVEEELVKSEPVDGWSSGSKKKKKKKIYTDDD